MAAWMRRCGNGVEVGEPVCGNGVVEAPETCDDGNTITEACDYGTTCPICTSECIEEERNGPFCGDGIVNADNGEACDAGGSSALCDDACQPITDFISVWRTTTDGESITLPLESGYAYNFNVPVGRWVRYQAPARPTRAVQAHSATTRQHKSHLCRRR